MNNNVITPKPPTLHWAVVLILSVVTLGLFGFYWSIRQAQFARRIDPINRAIFQILLSAALFLFQILISAVVAITVARGGQGTDLSSVMNILRLFEGLMIFTAYWQIRATLMKYYGIKLNGFLTLIFNVYYVQYHLSRLAKTQGVPLSSSVLPSSARSANA
jgi:hypothetical protein